MRPPAAAMTSQDTRQAGGPFPEDTPPGGGQGGRSPDAFASVVPRELGCVCVCEGGSGEGPLPSYPGGWSLSPDASPGRTSSGQWWNRSWAHSWRQGQRGWRPPSGCPPAVASPLISSAGLQRERDRKQSVVGGGREGRPPNIGQEGQWESKCSLAPNLECPRSPFARDLLQLAFLHCPLQGIPQQLGPAGEKSE